jgi:hypothetical protein
MEAHLFVAHHRDIVQAIKVGKRLEIGLVFNQLLSASANERIRYLTLTLLSC